MFAALLFSASLCCQVPVTGGYPSPPMNVAGIRAAAPVPRPSQAAPIPGQGPNLVNSPAYQYVMPWGLKTPGTRFQFLIVPTGKFVDITPIGAVGRYVIEVP